MKKEVVWQSDTCKSEISIVKLLYYILLFIVPIVTCFFLSIFLARQMTFFFQASVTNITRTLMIVFTFIIFLFVIPYIRKRENIIGVRFALLGTIIAGLAFTLPTALAGNINFLLTQLIYIASYILLTFIYCPEVLGMDVDLAHWFKSRKQLVILLVYSSITVFYVIGFGALFYEVAIDQTHPNAFSYSFNEKPTVGTFIYYSIVSFTTIGYGDVAPVSRAARFLTGFEAMLGMIINVVFISILLIFISSFQSAAQAREEKEIKKEEEILGKEETELKRAEKELVGYEEKEEKDIKQLLKKIKKIKK